MFLGGKVWRVHRADNLTAICEQIVYNVGSLTSHNPIGLHGHGHSSENLVVPEIEPGSLDL
jgi:hypothetical protein